MATQRRQRVRPLVVGWTVLLVACALAFALKFWQDYEVKAQRSALAEAQRAAESKALAAPSRVPVALEAALKGWDDGREPAPTTQVVADLINGGRPVAESMSGMQDWFWEDPRTHFTWRLRFRDDVLVGYQKFGAPTVGSPPPAPPPWLFDEVEEATLLILSRGWIAGAIVGVPTLLTLPFRRATWLAHLLAAVALVCLLATFMPSSHSLRGASPSLIDRLPAIFLMVGVAALATWHHRRPRKPRPGEPPRCVACGYDLTGNISGVCPECGGAVGIEANGSGEIQTPRSLSSSTPRGSG